MSLLRSAKSDQVGGAMLGMRQVSEHQCSKGRCFLGTATSWRKFKFDGCEDHVQKDGKGRIQYGTSGDLQKAFGIIPDEVKVKVIEFLNGTKADHSPPGSPATVPRESRKGKAKQTGGVDFHEIDEILQFELQGPERVQRYLIDWRNGDSTPTWENAGGICSVSICAFWNRVFADKAQYEQRRAPRAWVRPTKKMQANIASAAYWEELKNEGVVLELGVDVNLHLPAYIERCKMRVHGMWKEPFEVDDDENINEENRRMDNDGEK